MERKIVNDKSKILIKNLNPLKRPISAVADNIEVTKCANINYKKQIIRLNLIFYMI